MFAPRLIVDSSKRLDSSKRWTSASFEAALRDPQLPREIYHIISTADKSVPRYLLHWEGGLRIQLITTSTLHCLLGRSKQDIVLELQSRLFVALSRLEFDNQGIFDGEYRVVIQVLALRVKDLGGDGLVPLMDDLCTRLVRETVKSSSNN